MVILKILKRSEPLLGAVFCKIQGGFQISLQWTPTVLEFQIILSCRWVELMNWKFSAVFLIIADFFRKALGMHSWFISSSLHSLHYQCTLYLEIKFCKWDNVGERVQTLALKLHIFYHYTELQKGIYKTLPKIILMQ